MVSYCPELSFYYYNHSQFALDAENVRSIKKKPVGCFCKYYRNKYAD